MPPVRSAPTRWLIIYLIIAVAVFTVGYVLIRDRDARIEAQCRIGRENRAAVRDLIRDQTPIPTFGYPLADAPIRQYNEEIERRNARIEQRFQQPLPACGR